MFSKSFLPVDTVWLTRDSLRLYTCLTFPCRAYFIYGGNCLWQKAKTRAITKTSGTLLTEKDGTSILSWGKVRIKVSEHFAQDGKPLDSLLKM